MRQAKRCTALLCALMLLLCALPAMAETVYPRGTTPDGMERYRVALRAEPRDTAAVLYRVYNDVPLEVIGQAENGFVRVRMGGINGYMMAKFTASTPQKPHSDVLGNVDSPTGTLYVHSGPSLDGATYAELPNGSPMWMLAVGNKWHYVQPLEYVNGILTPMGTPGFVLAEKVTEAENFSFARPAGGVAQSMYKKPDADSGVITKVQADADISIMFSPDLHEGWQKVRIPGHIGYMRDKDLDRNGY